jgi:PAS domain S-box-containing protein
MCAAFEMMLSRHGFLADTAQSYENAREALRGKTFDAIISDIMLGPQDGLLLLETTNELQPDTPVILVTGHPSVESASTALRLKAYDYLSKPVAMKDLIQTVARAVELGRLRREKRRIELENQEYQRNLESLVIGRTAKLKESNLRFQLLFENSRDAIYMASWDGHFVDLNGAAVELFGYERDELMRMDVAALFPEPEPRERLRKEIETHGFVKDFEVNIQRREGSILEGLLTAHIFQAESGRILGYQAIVRDITAQKTAARKIAAQNAFLNTVIESLAHPFMVIDVADNTVRIANSAAMRSRPGEKASGFNLNREAEKTCGLIGQHEVLDEVVRGGRPLSIEQSHLDDTHRERCYEVHAYPIFDAGGKVSQVIQYSIDITERKRLESIAEAANLMDNLGYIFSGIRHEIGNPLNSVKMALSVLSLNLERYPLETIREFIERALAEVSRVEYLLKALKNFSLYETPRVEPVHLNGFLKNFLTLVEKDFGAKGIRILQRSTDPEIHVMTDHRALHQVLLNLLTNAADALENRDRPQIAIEVDRRADLVRIRMVDNGRGIPDADRRNLFRPFFTSKPSGTGLGLVIVKKMLAKMSGTIQIESVENDGTTVTIHLPEAEANDEKKRQTIAYRR